MEVDNEYLNPYGINITAGQRHIQIGRILHANFPVPWLPLIHDVASPIKILMKWVLDTERDMFMGSLTTEEYRVLVETTLAGAIEVDQEVKAQRLASGMTQPGHPSFFLSQLLTNLMLLCKRTQSSQLAESVLYVTCGMMELPPAHPVQHALFLVDPRINIHDLRENTCFRLLKWIFPDPFPDGKLYITQDLMKFGYRVEKEIWLRAISTQEYFECADDIRRQLIRFRAAENVYLGDGWMQYQVVAQNVAPIPVPVADDEEEGEEEEGGEEEEDEDEEEEGEEEEGEEEEEEEEDEEDVEEEY